MPMSPPKFPLRVSAPNLHREGQGDSEGWALRAEETPGKRETPGLEVPSLQPSLPSCVCEGQHLEWGGSQGLMGSTRTAVHIWRAGVSAAICQGHEKAPRVPGAVLPVLWIVPRSPQNSVDFMSLLFSGWPQFFCLFFFHYYFI